MIDINSIDEFRKAYCSLKECSKDKHDSQVLYMTESEMRVVNFDQVKDHYISRLSVSETPKSSDALYQNSEGKLFFIEFKNGKIDRKDEFGLKLKIYDSLLIFLDIIKNFVDFTRKELSFILVYDEEKNPKMDSFPKLLFKRAKGEIIRFGLERFKRLYFYEVYTVTKSEFEERFLKNWAS